MPMFVFMFAQNKNHGLIGKTGSAGKLQITETVFGGEELFLCA
jgi:hypothetical protein